MHQEGADPRGVVPTRTGRAKIGDLEIAYDIFGTEGRPLVLIMGIGAQRIFWPDELCEQFVAAGFHVARFDHRDVGESSKLDHLGVPHPGRALVRRFVLNRLVEAPYTLSEMAADTAKLIEALGWRRAHVAGVSLGGMVAQHMATEQPQVLRSMTSIMSTPGSRRYLPQPRALRALFMPRAKTAADAGRMTAEMFEAIGGGFYARPSERLERIGALAFERGVSPRGFLRHFAAVLATPDRRPGLRTTTVPSLIIHGSRDPMFPLRAGRDLARMMPDATWLPLTGMGHDLHEPLWPTLVAAIARHAERADARARV